MGPKLESHGPTAMDIRTWDKVEITIDAEAKPPTTIEILCKRMGQKEFGEFDRRFWRSFTSEAERRVLVRRDGPEMETTNSAAISDMGLMEARRRFLAFPAESAALADYVGLRTLTAEILETLTSTDRFVIDDEEIRRRRLVEMTAEQFAEYERVRACDQDVFTDFQDDAIRNYIRVPKGQLRLTIVNPDDATEESVPVLTGDQFLQCFGGRPDVLRQVIVAIRETCSLTEAQKKTSRSRSGSTTSSPGPQTGASGSGSAQAVEPASNSAPSASVDATPIEVGSSGPTAS